jgi:elongation factor P hydroxylase
MKLFTIVSIDVLYFVGFNFTSSCKYVKPNIIPKAAAITRMVAAKIPSLRVIDSGFSQFYHRISEGSGAFYILNTLW